MVRSDMVAVFSAVVWVLEILPVLPAKQLQNSLQKGKPFLPESVRYMLISHISRPLRVPMPP